MLLDSIIVVNDNNVLVDFLVMYIECDPSCPIILGRTFLRIVGAIIDMKEGTIRFQFPLKREWNTSLKIKSSYLMSPLHGQIILLELIKLNLLTSFLAKRHKKRLLGGNTKCFYFQF